MNEIRYNPTQPSPWSCQQNVTQTNPWVDPIHVQVWQCPFLQQSSSRWIKDEARQLAGASALSFLQWFDKSWLSDRKGIRPVKKPMQLNTKILFCDKWRKKLTGDAGDPGSLETHTHTHTYTHKLLYSPSSLTTQVSQCQKKKPWLYGARKDNRGRHINNTYGRHSIQTNQWPTSIIPHFYTGCSSCRNPPSLSWFQVHLEMVVKT